MSESICLTDIKIKQLCQFITSSDQFPVPEKSAVKSYLTARYDQNLTNRALKALTVVASTTELLTLKVLTDETFYKGSWSFTCHHILPFTPQLQNITTHGLVEWYSLSRVAYLHSPIQFRTCMFFCAPIGYM